MSVPFPVRPSPLGAAVLLALSAPPAAHAADAARATTAASAPAPSAQAPVLVASAAPPDAPQQVVVTALKADNGYDARISASATGLDLSRRETPQSISVISRQEMDDFSLTGINQVLSLTPGVTVESVETDRTYFTSRGFDITNFQVDGIGLPFSNSNLDGDIDTFLYDRIEILRGANGLLSSTGNPSATVNFVRKRPTREFEASAGVTIGSFKQRRVEGDVGGALNESGSVRARLIVTDESHDSWLKRYSVSKKSVAGLVDVDLAPRTTLEIGFAQQTSDADSPMWGALPLTYSDGTLASYPRSTSTAADWAWWNHTDRRAHAELTHDFGNGWKATGIVTRRYTGSNSELFYVYGNEDPVTHTGAQAYPSSFGGHYDQTMADIRLSGPFRLFGRTHSLSLGADWSRETAAEHSGYPDDIGAPVPSLSTWDGSFPKPSFDASSDGSNWRTVRRTVFAAAHLNATDALNLIVGANATSVASSGENYGTAHAYSRDAVSPYLGATYDIDDNTSAYTSFTRIFNPQTELDASHQPLKPIRGSSLEGGVKSEWFAKRLETAVSVFRTRQQNTATQVATLPNGTAVYSGQNAVSTGFEAEVTGRLTPGWDINAGYAQLRIKGDDGQATRLFVPRRTLRLATTYRIPGVPGLKIGGTATRQSEVSTIDASAGVGDIVVRQPGYALIGLMAHYDITPHWSTGLNVDNLANKKYWSSLYWNQSFYGAPRSVTASLRWTY